MNYPQTRQLLLGSWLSRYHLHLLPWARHTGGPCLAFLFPHFPPQVNTESICPSSSAFPKSISSSPHSLIVQIPGSLHTMLSLSPVLPGPVPCTEARAVILRRLRSQMKLLCSLSLHTLSGKSKVPTAAYKAQDGLPCLSGHLCSWNVLCVLRKPSRLGFPKQGSSSWPSGLCMML